MTSRQNAEPESIQLLEARRILAASLNGNILTVAGDGNANVIAVERSITAVDEVVVSIDGDEQRFASAAVISVFVNAGGGDDLVSIGRVGAERVVNGESGSDTLLGGRFNDVLEGGDGPDSIDGSSSDDELNGGRGADTLIGGGGHDRLQGDGGDDSMDGGSGLDRFDGGIGADTMLGRGGNDGFHGWDLNRSLDSSPDVFFGGGGRDGIDYDLSGAAVDITLDGIANDGMSGEGDNVGSDIEDFALSLFDDWISLAGIRGRHYVLGSNGNDTIIGSLGADSLVGAAGNDSIDGSEAQDRIFGDAGDDIILAADSLRDVVRGGTGNDSATVDSGLDALFDVETTT